MAFNQPDISPAVAEAIHRQLAAAPGARLNEETLARRVIPKALQGGPGNTLFRETLRELRGVGALEESDDGSVRLPADVPQADSPGAMAGIVRSKIMAAELERDLWERDENGLVLTGAVDLVRSLAWILSLDPAEAPFEWDASSSSVVELQQQQLTDLVIYNEERWRPFTRWAVFLGFAKRTSQYALIPDPTGAVSDTLSILLKDRAATSVPLGEILPALGSALPVLDSGAYRRALIDHGAPGSEGGVSPALALAFKRLEKAGRIELEVAAGDAPKVIFSNNQGSFHALRWHRSA